jgi:uncharacterized protein YciI
VSDDADLPEAGPPEEFDQYTLVLLMRGEHPPQLDEAESDRLQRQHLGHLLALQRRGLLIASGPFHDQPDDTWRGLCIYRVGLEEARVLAESDPAVRRGRLKVIAFTWFTRPGALQG